MLFLLSSNPLLLLQGATSSSTSKHKLHFIEQLSSSAWLYCACCSVCLFDKTNRGQYTSHDNTEHRSLRRQIDTSRPRLGVDLKTMFWPRPSLLRPLLTLSNVLLWCSAAVVLFILAHFVQNFESSVRNGGGPSAGTIIGIIIVSIQTPAPDADATRSRSTADCPLGRRNHPGCCGRPLAEHPRHLPRANASI